MTVLSIIPESPVKETWEFLTDIITSRNGSETRLSLREYPRVRLDADFVGITQRKRSLFTQFVITNIDNVTAIPVWPYLSKLTEDASSGATTIKFDVVRVPVVTGGKIVLVDERTEYFEEFVVDTVAADGCTITTGLSQDVTTSFYAILGMDVLIEGDPSKNIDSITGNVGINFRSWTEPELQRPGTVASLTTYDSLPVLDKRPLAGKSESFEILKEIQDNDTGLRSLTSPWDHATIKNSMDFIVQRIITPEEFDYWRLFFATTRGAWKPFLVPTYMNDFNLTTSLVQGGTSVMVEETGDFVQFEAFSRIEIEYSDGTISRHTITSAISGTLVITPALPSDPKVSSVTRISHLLKMRGADTVTLSHTGFATLISFDAFTTDEG